LALQQAGIPATVLNAEKANLTTIGPLLDAELNGLDKAKVFAALQNAVVVLPGFIGRGNDGVTTLLGRGGSDLTALFVSHQLGGNCRLVKDVDGLYTSDPNKPSGGVARRFAKVSYETARLVGGSVVQIKAVDFAEKHRLSFTISSIGSAISTEVGPCRDCIDREVETVEEEECAA
jgi:homoserine dehydrogenase